MTLADQLLLIVGASCFFVQAVIGPSLADRVIAIDGLVVTILGVILVHSIRTDTHWFIGVAVVASLVGFLGTTAAARFIERRGA